MKRFLKLFIVVVLAATSLALEGCSIERDLKNRDTEKVQFVSFDKVRGGFKEGFRISITVTNNTIHNIRLTDATANLMNNGKKIGVVTLKEEVVLPRRRTSQVEVPVRLTIGNARTALSLIGGIKSGNIPNLTVDLSITAKTALLKRTLEKRDIPLNELSALFDYKKR
jgi:hypothetical protein